MPLSGPEIARQVNNVNIGISPFDPGRLNPNSYNLSLGRKLLCYAPGSFSSPDAMFSTRRKPPPADEVEIPDTGFILQTGWGYLGTTVERTYCEGLVPILDGRSGTGRMFLMVHVTAGYGDDGFDGHWTVEMVALVRPVEVFPGDQLFQIRFEPVVGDRMPYRGSYQGQADPTPSRMFRT